MIIAQDLSYRYGTQLAVDRVTFGVPKGEMFGLLGPNGSGKTTLFRILCTLLPVQKGRAVVNGFDLAAQPQSVRSSIGITFQSPAIDPRLTVDQNLSCHGQIFGLRRHAIQTRSDSLLSQFQMERYRSTPGSKLSGGQKRRIELIMGLLHSPSALFLDEPTTGLDVRSRQQFFATLADVRRAEGTTVVIATHLMEEAELCDRIMLMNHGSVVATDTPASLKSQISGDRLTVSCRALNEVRDFCTGRLNITPQVLSSNELTMHVENAGELASQILTECRAFVESVYVSRPSLEDVFLQLTGGSLAGAVETQESQER